MTANREDARVQLYFASLPSQLGTLAIALSSLPFLIAFSNSRLITYNLMQVQISPKVCQIILDIIGAHVLGHRTYYECLSIFYCVMLTYMFTSAGYA